jgi:hypothetical protein
MLYSFFLCILYLLTGICWCSSFIWSYWHCSSGFYLLSFVFTSVPNPNLVNFWASQVLPSSSKNIKETLDIYWYLLLLASLRLLLVRGTDPMIRIGNKMSRFRNTGFLHRNIFTWIAFLIKNLLLSFLLFPGVCVTKENNCIDTNIFD